MSDNKFRITTAWAWQGEERPWLISSYCESTEDIWGGVPEHFTNDVNEARKNGDEVRVVKLLLDIEAIEKQFTPITVEADVSSEETKTDG